MAKIRIYTKDNCAYCVRAKNFLNNKQIPFDEIHISDPDEMVNLKKKTGWATFPQIFINEVLVGGYDDLAALDREGKLEALLAK